jgi:CBS domain-containing membrane protein
MNDSTPAKTAHAAQEAQARAPGLSKDRLRNWFKALKPAAVTVDSRERWRAACGAALGLLLTAFISRWLMDWSPYPLALVAPLGASALLVFAVPASPMAQPWAVVAGNFVSALVGVACARAIDNPLIAGPVAVGLAIVAMFALRCLHPPGGAMALTAVLSHATSFPFAVFPAFTESLLLVLAGMAYNTATGRRYPHVQAAPGSSVTDSARRFSSADIDAVLADYNQVLDVSRDDLESLLQRAEVVAYRRRLGEIRCADIMSRDLVMVQFGSSLEEAWALMRQHKVKALPVVDRVRRIVGIVSMADFLRHADMDVHDGLGQRLQSFLRATPGVSSDKPETVGQIMSRKVRVSGEDRHIVDLVPAFSEHGHHHIPIVDKDNRLVGIITQSDLVRALFHAVEPSATPL